MKKFLMTLFHIIITTRSEAVSIDYICNTISVNIIYLTFKFQYGTHLLGGIVHTQILWTHNFCHIQPSKCLTTGLSHPMHPSKDVIYLCVWVGPRLGII